MTLEPPLSEAELDELDAFLASEATSECMDIFTLDGFLTALVIGPQSVAPRCLAASGVGRYKRADV